MIHVWQKYLKGFKKWEDLVQGITPKKTGCGQIYELGQPLERPNEDLAVADMRDVLFTQPHYHPETEIYFVLQGRGRAVVGSKEASIQTGSIILVPSNLAHYTIPEADLVIAVVATPPYNPKNSNSLYEENKTVLFDFEQFRRLTHGRL